MSMAPQKITFDYKGQALELTPSHDLYMQIEEKIPFGRLATLFSAASTGANTDIPMSHVSWVVYCAVCHCGVRVSSSLEVHQAVFEQAVKWGPLIASLIAAYYGALPKKASVPKKPKAASRNSRR